MKNARFKILSVPVDAVTTTQSIEFAKKNVLEGGQISILAVNPEKIITARRDQFLLETLNESELLIPDGIGVVLTAKMKGIKSIKRVAGADLMPELCSMAANENFPVFLFGASEEVNLKAADILSKRFPALKIAGRQNGYMENNQYTNLVERINASGAKLLFVALGSPRQEHFIKNFRKKLHVNVLQGVGGTFDVLSGNTRRAPLFFQKLNLEWFYRLLSNPTRIFRQTALLKFIFLICIDFLFSSKRD